MIEYTLPSRRTPPVVKEWPYVGNKQTNSPTYTIIAEAKRRDDIVKELFRTCPYKEGDIVQPHSLSAQNKYGKEILVEKICDTYAKFGKTEEWPTSDCPMLVTAFSHKTDERFYCTVGYLVPL